MFMDKHLILEDVQKEVHSIIYDLKTGLVISHSSSDSNQPATQLTSTKDKEDRAKFLTRSEKAKKRLLEIQGILQEHLRLWHHNINVLKDDGSKVGNTGSQANYREAQQSANDKIYKIRKLLDDISLALDHARGVIQKHKDFNNFAPITKPLDFMDTFKKQSDYGVATVTYETVPLLDAGRYGTLINYPLIIDYPQPNLASPEAQRQGSLLDKIRIGLGLLEKPQSHKYRIAIPQYFKKLFSGKYLSQNTNAW